MDDTLHYYRTAKRPDLRFTWEDDDGTVINFSTGYTFAFKLGQPGTAATFTKTTGITGAATAPNVTIAFTGVEMDSLALGTTTWQLTATSSGLPRVMQGQFVLHDVIL